MEIVGRAGRLPVRVVGDLIGVEAGTLEHSLRGLVEGGGEVLVRRGPGAAGDGAAEGGRRLYGQLVGRDVFEAEIEGLGQLGGPARDGLVGAGVDQVDGKAREGAGGDGDGAAGLVRRMVAAEEGEGRVVQRLHPHGQAVDAGVGQGGEAGGLGVGGIGLERDLDGAAPREEGFRPVDDGGHGFRRHQRRGAAAEEDRGQTAGTGQGRLRFHIGEDGFGQRRLFLNPAPVAHDVEVAIRADAGAVRPVDVEGEVAAGVGGHEGDWWLVIGDWRGRIPVLGR